MNSFQHTFLDTFERFITDHALVKPGDRVLLAVSGGIDSMVMLDAFSRIQSAWGLSLSVVHVNHQLRGEESQDDEEFLREAVRKLGLPFLTERVNVKDFQSKHHLSKQEAARTLRYEALERARIETKSKSVTTGHHADDNAETVLMNALRGAGVRGLSGIPIRRDPGSVIRPLLFAYRKDIENYAVTLGIRYREDSSNSSLQYKRNLLRHSLLPFLNDELQTDAARSLNRVSALMRSLGEKLSSETAKVSVEILSVRDGMTAVSIPKLLGQALVLQEEILLGVLRDHGIEPTTQKVQACLELCSQPTGRSLDLSADWCILHNRGELLLHHRVERAPFEREVLVGQEYDFGTFRFASRLLDRIPNRVHYRDGAEVVDADKLGHLVLRTWKEGDWFMPLGMKGRKKLSDYFVNSKVPKIEKHATPILESDGAIVWVCGHRLDQRFSISDSTHRAMELRFERHPTL
ncbi:MAG: tRNA lysidine(34) synthetase TilS [Bacteroidota bacterium]